MATVIVTFSTTHHALWAEEIAMEQGVPCETVPAPAEANAKCNIALEVMVDDVPRLGNALSLAGVEFDLYRPPS